MSHQPSACRLGWGTKPNINGLNKRQHAAAIPVGFRRAQPNLRTPMSHQLSPISHQLSAITHHPSPITHQLNSM